MTKYQFIQTCASTYRPFNVGDRVAVRHPGKYLTTALIGEQGTVRRVYPGSIAVALDTVYNDRSSKGHFYFTEEQIMHANAFDKWRADNSHPEDMGDNVPEELKGEHMKLDGNYKIAHVDFIDELGTKVYQYALYEEHAKVGDLALVKALGAHKLVKILEISDEPSDGVEITAEIICLVDTSSYGARIERRRKREELKAQMKARAAQLQELALYEMMAKNDGAMKALMEEYSALEAN